MNMRKLPAILVIAALSSVLASCGEDDDERPSSAQMRSSPAAAAKTGAAAEGELGRPGTVPGKANIYGAGRAHPPDPGGGGPGVRPRVWQLPDGAHRVVSFPGISGQVNPIVGTTEDNGPGGDGVGPTDVTSYRGLSGIVHRRNGMFLVGVFLTDDPPAGQAPPRLDFTKRERFRSLSPRIGQTFFVGDGERRSYRVPPEATRLFLGFADGYDYQGPPGWYDNNGGELSVTVEMTSG